MNYSFKRQKKVTNKLPSMWINKVFYNHLVMFKHLKLLVFWVTKRSQITGTWNVSAGHLQYTLSTYLKNACHKSQDKFNKEALEMAFIAGRLGPALPCQCLARRLSASKAREWMSARILGMLLPLCLFNEAVWARALPVTNPRTPELTMDVRREARRESAGLQPCDPRAV